MALLATVLVLFILAFVWLKKGVWNLAGNEIGDFIAGFFTLLAFIWIVATARMQTQEMRRQAQEMRVQRRAMEATAKAQELQNFQMQRQILAAARLHISQEAIRLEEGTAELRRHFAATCANVGWRVVANYQRDRERSRADERVTINGIALAKAKASEHFNTKEIDNLLEELSDTQVPPFRWETLREWDANDDGNTKKDKMLILHAKIVNARLPLEYDISIIFGLRYDYPNFKEDSLIRALFPVWDLAQQHGLSQYFRQQFSFSGPLCLDMLHIYYPE